MHDAWEKMLTYHTYGFKEADVGSRNNDMGQRKVTTSNFIG